MLVGSLRRAVGEVKSAEQYRILRGGRARYFAFRNQSDPERRCDAGGHYDVADASAPADPRIAALAVPTPNVVAEPIRENQTPFTKSGRPSKV